MWHAPQRFRVSAALPPNARHLHAVAKTALLASELESYDKRASRFRFTRVVIMVSFVVARDLIIKNAEETTVRAIRAEEVEVIGAICSSTKPSFLDGFGSMCVFHVSDDFSG